MKASKAQTVDDYIGAFDGEVKKRLITFRKLIKKVAPKAEEMISYNMPLYKLEGMLVSFAAWKSHIALYPKPKTSGKLKKQLQRYEGAKSTLRFPLDEPLPPTLIAKVVKLRMSENKTRGKMKEKK